MGSALLRIGRLVLALIAVWTAINLFDESPDATIPQAPPADSFISKAQDNGFFALAGIGEPEGRTPAERHAAGIKRYQGELARWGAYLQQTNPGVFTSGETRKPLSEFAGPEKPALTAELSRDSLCDWQAGPCLVQIEKRRAGVEPAVQQHQWLQARYLELYGYPSFVMPVPDDAVFAMAPSPLHGIEQGGALVRTSAALAALDGRGTDALKMLAADIRFYRALLRSANSIIQTNVAAMSIARDLSLLEEIVGRDPGLRQSAGAVVAEALQPFTAAERNLEQPLRGTFVSTTHILKTLGAGKGWEATVAFSRPFYRQNAHLNYEWQRQQALIRLLAQTPGDDAEAAVERWVQQGIFPESGIWHAARNFVGTIVSQASLPSSGGHFLRLHDVDAYQRMLAIRFGVIGADFKAPLDGFQSKTIARSADGRTLTFKPGGDSRWPKHLASVAVPESTAK